MDILDLFNGGANPSKKKISSAVQQSAPIELVTDFLLHVSSGEMKEALQLSERILEFEPNNKMILDYVKTLRQFIDQEMDAADDQSSSEEEESSNESDKNEDSEEENTSDDDEKEGKLSKK